MVLATGKPIAEVARDLGVHDGTLGNWVNGYRREHPGPDQPLTAVERARVREMEDEIRRLRLENEFLTKSGGLLRSDAAVASRCAFIESEKANYDFTFMCRMLSVPRSSFYTWLTRVDSATAVRRAALAVEVARVFDAHHGRFGCRRIGVDLNETGWPCSVGLIADIMRDLGLKAVQPRAYRVTTRRGEDPFPVPDLLDREFTAGVGTAGDRLVGDIPYLRTGQGWLYLATVIDLTTRMVVGWQLAEHMRTSLVVDAMQMAIDAGRVNHDAIFHSDRGTQGGFNWSSQHLDLGGVRWGDGRKQVPEPPDGCAAAVGGGSGVATADAFTGPA